MTMVRTAADISSPFADPAHLDREKVRCLWIRRASCAQAPGWIPTVLFEDGSFHPLAFRMDEIEAKRICQRLAAIYDWPVWDSRTTRIGPTPRTGGTFRIVPKGYNAFPECHHYLTMKGMGCALAEMAQAQGLDLGEATTLVTERIAGFFGRLTAQICGPSRLVEDAMETAVRAAFERLCELWPDDREETGQSIARSMPSPPPNRQRSILSFQPVFLGGACLAVAEDHMAA